MGVPPVGTLEAQGAPGLIGTLVRPYLAELGGVTLPPGGDMSLHQARSCTFGNGKGRIMY